MSLVLSSFSSDNNVIGQKTCENSGRELGIRELGIQELGIRELGIWELGIRELGKPCGEKLNNL